MLIHRLKSKLHRVTVTDKNLTYEGSCAIDSDLMDAACIREYEMLHIYNVNNGERFTTYAIPAEPKTGIISVRGAAARKVCEGDRLIICTYAYYSAQDSYNKPIIVYVDDNNMDINK